METFNFPEKIDSYGSPFALCKGYFWNVNNAGGFEWKKVGRENIFGEISCIQTSCPRVEISTFYEKNNTKFWYIESTGWGAPEIELAVQTNNGGDLWIAYYSDDELQSVEKKDPSILNNETDTLSVDDSSCLIQSLSYKLENTFP